MSLSVASDYTSIAETVFSSAIAAKAWLATIAIALAMVQISTAARIYGRLPGVIRLSPGAVGGIHRWSGRLAVLFTLPVAFHCVFILGFQTTDTRVAVHSIVATFVYGVLVAKLLVLKTSGYPSWVLPTMGGSLFLVLATVWWTSSLWYFTEVRFGF